ncbi:choline-binding protein A [Veillonella parvula]
MENQNILTIKFNDTEDLALKIAEWNEILNHQCCGSCHDSKAPTATVCETIDVDVVTPKVNPKVVKIRKVEAEEETPNKVAKEEQEQDIHVTDLEGNPIKAKKEEKVEPVVEPKPAETTKVEEQTPIETPKQDTELDVAAEPVDKKAFYKEFRAWMGEDGVKAKKALAIFSKHGVTRPSSDSLTDDLITDLKSIMAEEA